MPAIPPSEILIARYLPRCSAVYFIWHNGNVVYVGRAKDLKNRISGHEKVEKDDQISWIEVPKYKLVHYEAFYIWMCKPMLNGGMALNPEDWPPLGDGRETRRKYTRDLEDHLTRMIRRIT
jgi:hypothetical protein